MKDDKPQSKNKIERDIDQNENNPYNKSETKQPGKDITETDSNNIKENKNNSEGKSIEEATDPSKLSKL